MFICCGDALVDLFSQPMPGKVSLLGHVGGSPLNVAVGLARLGNKSFYFCKNSTDFIGQEIASYLSDNHVATDLVVPTSLNSTLAMVKTNADGSARYAFYTDNTADVSLQLSDLPADLPADTHVLHFGSYSTVVEPTASTLIKLAEREQGRRLISYDPNVRSTIEPDVERWIATYDQLSSVAGFIKASDEDLAFLFGESYSPDAFASSAIARGASIVVVTRGERGALGFSADGQEVEAASLSVPVADTVGAGDTFQATSLHWLAAQGCIQNGSINLNGLNLQNLVDVAATAAGITCSRHGADMPNLAELENALESAGIR